MHRLFYGTVGALVSLALVLSCSDDSTSDADAATCDCEPSLEGRIVMVENATSGTSIITAIVACPAGAFRLGGGCELLAQSGDRTLHLRQAGFRSDLPGNYGCEWDNPDNFQATGKAWVTCLVPAP